MTIKHKLKCSHCKKQNVVLLRYSKRVSKGKFTQYYMCRECNTERAKKYRETKAGKKNVFNAVYASMKRYPEKTKARSKVREALKQGQVIKIPCQCGNKKSEAHHPDYSKPLDVIWLCRQCHFNLHREVKFSIMA